MATKSNVFNIACNCGKKWRVNRAIKSAQFSEGLAMGGAKDPALPIKKSAFVCTCGVKNSF